MSSISCRAFMDYEGLDKNSVCRKVFPPLQTRMCFREKESGKDRTLHCCYRTVSLFALCKHVFVSPFCSFWVVCADMAAQYSVPDPSTPGKMFMNYQGLASYLSSGGRSSIPSSHTSSLKPSTPPHALSFRLFNQVTTTG